MENETKTTQELIDEINAQNKELGDPELVAMTSQGPMPASQAAAIQEHLKDLEENNEEFQKLNKELVELEAQALPKVQRLNEIFQETFKPGEKPVN